MPLAFDIRNKSLQTFIWIQTVVSKYVATSGEYYLTFACSRGRLTLIVLKIWMSTARGGWVADNLGSRLGSVGFVQRGMEWGMGEGLSISPNFCPHVQPDGGTWNDVWSCEFPRAFLAISAAAAIDSAHTPSRPLPPALPPPSPAPRPRLLLPTRSHRHSAPPNELKCPTIRDACRFFRSILKCKGCTVIDVTKSNYLQLLS